MLPQMFHACLCCNIHWLAGVDSEATRRLMRAVHSSVVLYGDARCVSSLEGPFATVSSNVHYCFTDNITYNKWRVNGITQWRNDNTGVKLRICAQLLQTGPNCDALWITAFDAKNVYNKGQWLIAQVHWGKQVHLVQRSDMYMPTTQRAELLMLVAQRETGA